MDELIDSVKKEVLIEMVKLTQKKGMKGSKGDWKEFLKSYDKKFGSSLCDPSRRSDDSLSSFLKTFEEEEDIKFFKRVLMWHSNREGVEKFKEISPDNETSEQGLVHSTLVHHLYPIEYSFPSYEEDWVIVKCSKKPKAMKSTKLIAIDCEMVLCEDGTDALVKVCAVDRDLKVKLEEVVNPNKPIADYRTAITGMSAKDFDGVTTSLKDVQIRLKKLLSHGTILIGHSVNNDLQVLKLDHARVIDTSYVFKFANAARKPSLSLLCKSLLGYEVRQEGNPHDCVDDAIGAMKLVLARLEGKIDTVIADEARVLDPAKLLVHRIPADISSEDLRSILSGNCSIEVKAAKTPGKRYSALAVFKNRTEATEFYENLKGDSEEDNFGQPQKVVKFNLDSGKSGFFCVRGSLSEGPAYRITKKRSAEDDGNSTEVKRLKEEISQRDEEISNLYNIIASLSKKLARK